MQPSQYAQNAASEALTAALLGHVANLANRPPHLPSSDDGATMELSTAEDSADVEMDEETEAELRRLVERTVMEGVGLGFGMSEEQQRREDETGDEKRTRI